ncbi:hypothetical protein EGJ58_23190 [Brucella anthropi]|nr:hypothetical protein EGJ58_23190 [Brucella anthropi]
MEAGFRRFTRPDCNVHGSCNRHGDCNLHAE